MEYWTWPAYAGVLGGIVLFLVTLLPILVIQYRRFGAVSGPRLLGAAGFSIWVVALVAYTLILSPTDPKTWCRLHAVDSIQLRPFHFVGQIRDATAGFTWRERLLSPVTLQVVFNVCLFIPLGVWCRRFFGLRLVTTTLIGLAVSLAVESTQYTGVWGLFPCSYRYADVDDLMTNTVGAFLGGLGSWFVLGWMPSSERLEAARLRPRPVTRRRRLLGMLLDVLIYVAAAAGFATLYRLADYAADRRVPVDLGVLDALLTYVVPALVVFVVPAMIGRGASLGQRIVWLAPARRNGSPAPLAARLVRSSVTGLAVGAAAFVSATWSLDVVDWFVLVWPALAVLGVLVTPQGRGLSFLLSGLVPVDARTGREHNGSDPATTADGRGDGDIDAGAFDERSDEAHGS